MKSTLVLLVLGFATTALAFTSNSPDRKDEGVDHIVNMVAALSRHQMDDKSFECAQSCFRAYIRDAFDVSMELFSNQQSTAINKDGPSDSEFPIFRTVIMGLFPLYERFEHCIIPCDDGELKDILIELKKPFDYIKDNNLTLVGNSIKSYEAVWKKHEGIILEVCMKEDVIVDPSYPFGFSSMAIQGERYTAAEIQEIAQKACNFHACVGRMVGSLILMADPGSRHPALVYTVDPDLFLRWARANFDSVLYFWTKYHYMSEPLTCSY